MTPRERIATALSHQAPDRVPFAWGFGPQPPARKALNEYLAPWGMDFDGLSRRTADLRQLNPAYIGPTLAPNATIFGYTTKATSYGAGTYDEFDFQPLATATSVDDIERHPWPSADWFDYESFPAQLRAADPAGRLCLECSGGHPMEIFTWMVGLERTFEMMACEEEMFHAGMRHLTDFFVAKVRRTLQAGRGRVDMVFTADDLGSQNGPLISRDMYRRLVLPYHKELHGAIKQFGPFISYHSDGSVFALLDDLLEAGITALEAVQVECQDMNPRKLKEAYRGRLAFRGAVSVQQILPRVTAPEVRAEVRRLKAILGKGGGYICTPSHAIQAGTPPENVIAMMEEACETTMDQVAKMEDPA